MAAEQEGAIPVASLGVNELNRLREQLQGDVEHLLESHSLLGRAVARSEAAGKAVATLAASKPGMSLHTPLPQHACMRDRETASAATQHCVLPPLRRTHADQPLMLPLTGSLYVKGKVASSEQLLVNIGTDYFVEVCLPVRGMAV